MRNIEGFKPIDMGAPTQKPIWESFVKNCEIAAKLLSALIDSCTKPSSLESEFQKPITTRQSSSIETTDQATQTDPPLTSLSVKPQPLTISDNHYNQLESGLNQKIEAYKIAYNNHFENPPNQSELDEELNDYKDGKLNEFKNKISEGNIKGKPLMSVIEELRQDFSFGLIEKLAGKIEQDPQKTTKTKAKELINNAESEALNTLGNVEIFKNVTKDFCIHGEDYHTSIKQITDTFVSSHANLHDSNNLGNAHQQTVTNSNKKEIDHTIRHAAISIKDPDPQGTTLKYEHGRITDPSTKWTADEVFNKAFEEVKETQEVVKRDGLTEVEEAQNILKRNGLTDEDLGKNQPELTLLQTVFNMTLGKIFGKFRQRININQLGKIVKIAITRFFNCLL